MPEDVTWERLKRSAQEPLSKGDRIEVAEEPGDAFEVELTNGDGITLWKGVTLTGGEIVDWNSKFWIARIELMDDFRGPVSFRLRPDHLDGCTLFFGKDEQTGRKPSNTYVVRDFPRRGRIRLRWVAD
jgi:hypothetical protein